MASVLVGSRQHAECQVPIERREGGAPTISDVSQGQAADLMASVRVLFRVPVKNVTAWHPKANLTLPENFNTCCGPSTAATALAGALFAEKFR
jgi:hypothetical protein